MKNESSLAAVWVIFIAVISLALGAGGVWYWQESQELAETAPPAATQPTTTPGTTPTSSTPPSPSDVENWQNYTNTKYGYSLKYPSDRYKLIEDYDEGTAGAGQGTDVIIDLKEEDAGDSLFLYPEQSASTPKAFVDTVIQESEKVGGKSSNRKTGTFVGLATEEFDLSRSWADATGGESLPNPIHVVVFKRGDNVWVIRYLKNEATVPTILSTFKFTS